MGRPPNARSTNERSRRFETLTTWSAGRCPETTGRTTNRRVLERRHDVASPSALERLRSRLLARNDGRRDGDLRERVTALAPSRSTIALRPCPPNARSRHPAGCPPTPDTRSRPTTRPLPAPSTRACSAGPSRVIPTSTSCSHPPTAASRRAHASPRHADLRMLRLRGRRRRLPATDGRSSSAPPASAAAVRPARQMVSMVRRARVASAILRM